jgi:MipA family protein
LTVPRWRVFFVLAVLSLSAVAEVVPGEPQAPGQPAPPRDWDLAIGFIMSHGPEYVGSDRYGTGVVPGLGLRWKNVSFTSNSAFAVRTSDPAATGGLRIELPSTEHFRVGVSLRYDRGRQEDSNDAFKGMGDVPGGVLVRVHPRYILGDGWQLGGSITFSPVGKGPGSQGEVSIGHDMRLTEHTTFGAGLALGLGSSRFMQNYFGVTEEQSARSGYPVYEASGGVSAVAASAGARTELGRDWRLLYGAGASHLLGAAAESPMTRRRNSWSLNAGLVYLY